MSTGWIIFIIVMVLAVIASNLILLKKSAKFGLKKGSEAQNNEEGKNDNPDSN